MRLVPNNAAVEICMIELMPNAVRKTIQAFPTRLWAVMAVLQLAVIASAAASQHGTGGFAVPGPVVAESSGGGESHGWMVAPSTNSDNGSSLIHLPPRDLAGDQAARYSTVADGAVQVATRLERAPERLCAWERTVYLIFGSERVGEDRKQRRILSVTTSPSPVGKTWTYNTTGRLRVCAALPGEGQLVGAAGSDKGLVALLRSGEEGGARERFELLVMHHGQWSGLDLADLDDGPGLGRESVSGADVRLIGMPEGVGILVIQAGGRGSFWHARFEELPEVAQVPVESGQPSRASDESGPEPFGFKINWEERSIPLAASGGSPVVPDGAVYWIRESLVYAVRDADRTLSIRSANERSNREIARLFEVPGQYAAAPIEQVGRLAILWIAESEDDSSGKGNAYEIREVSALTGRLMYEGQAHAERPVSANEFRVLAFMLVVVMAVVLLFVLRSDEGQRAVHLPPDRVLAEPSRRAVAGLVDVLPCAWIVGQIYGISIAKVFGTLLFMGVGQEVAPLLLVLGLGFIHTTLCEWLFGRSLGKALTGCEVISVAAKRKPGASPVDDEAVGPRLWQAAVRNLVRWAIPPVAILGMADLSRRHRGDILAKTAVVVPVLSEPETDSEGGTG